MFRDPKSLGITGVRHSAFQLFQNIEGYPVLLKYHWGPDLANELYNVYKELKDIFTDVSFYTLTGNCDRKCDW